MKVDSLVPVKDHKSILARFNLILNNGFIIRDIRLMTGSKGRWISWPSRQYKDKEGKDKYFDYIQIDDSRKESILAEIKAQVELLLSPVPDNTLEEIPF